MDLHLPGKMQIVLGILMIILHRPLGVWILKFAKKSFINTNFPSYVPKELIDRKIKNIEKTNGPLVFLIIGIGLTIQGIGFLLFPDDWASRIMLFWKRILPMLK